VAFDPVIADRVRSILEGETELSTWVERGVSYARSLPPT
jgi:hypothetical protein